MSAGAGTARLSVPRLLVVFLVATLAARFVSDVLYDPVVEASAIADEAAADEAEDA